MKRAAVSISRDLLDRARVASATIDNAKSPKEVEVAWSNFLTPAHRIFSKLEQGAKTNTHSQDWFKKKKVERRSNEILKYLHHARNADEHGLAKVLDQTQPGLALGVGPGAWRFDGTLGPGGTLRVTAMGGQVPGQSKFVEKIPAKIKLRTVIDRGVSYDPPKNDSGSGMLPNEAAKAALVFLETMIAEADQLANQSS